MSREIQELVLSGASDRKFAQAAWEAGMKTLVETGVEKSIAGETSFEEVLRATSAY
jgi:type II secretory ATPase GspE/PulE/Tfp pilus assembly ATPase PilB-like protein